jgi:uncharacterized phage-associated protein
MIMTNSLKAVANFFLDKAEEAGDALTPLKLQKLVYFAHGWHLAILNRPLIEEPIQAWQYGPVIEALYHEFKECGNGPIHFRLNSPFSWGERPRVEDPETLELVNKVWDIYKRYTAVELSAMTHATDGPWNSVWGKGATRHAVIPNSLITSYFRGIAAKKA